MDTCGILSTVISAATGSRSHYSLSRKSARSQLVFTARRYASAVYAMALCPSVSVCLSQVGVLLKRLNTGSHKQNTR